MYIFGSVRFEIQPGVQFIVENGEFTVNANISVVEDDFDYESTSFPANVLNPFLEFLADPQHHNYKKVILIYEGKGPNQTVRVIPENDFCFSAGTFIDMWQVGSEFTPDPSTPLRASNWRHVTQYQRSAQRIFTTIMTPFEIRPHCKSLGFTPISLNSAFFATGPYTPPKTQDTDMQNKGKK